MQKCISQFVHVLLNNHSTINHELQFFTHILHLQLPLPISHRHATSHGALLYQLYKNLLSRFVPFTFLTSVNENKLPSTTLVSLLYNSWLQVQDLPVLRGRLSGKLYQAPPSVDIPAVSNYYQYTFYSI